MKKVLGIILALAMVVAIVPFSVPSSQAEASDQSSQSPEIVVDEGENFEILLSQAINPFYEWICDGFDEEYVSLLDTYYQPPAGGIVGVTNKVFLFEALKAGVTEIQFGAYKLDASGNPIELIRSKVYKVQITEKSPYALPFIEPLEVEVVEHSSGCFAGGYEEGTTAVWDNGNILATTIVKTSVPCYDLQSVQATRIGDDIAVHIVFQQEEGACIECVGFQKVVYKIISPGTDVVNLGVRIEIDSQQVWQHFYYLPGVVGPVSPNVSPSQPVVGDDITITVSGDFSAINYAITKHHHLIMGSTIFIWGEVVQTAPVGAQVITPWEFTENIGKLPSGDYTVKVLLNRQQVASTQFDVSPFLVSTDQPAYLPGEMVNITITNVGHLPITKSLTLTICDEEGHEFYGAVFQLHLNPLMPGESISETCHPNTSGKYTAQVTGAGFQRSAEFTVVEAVDIGNIWENPSDYVGKYVLINGKYMGWSNEYAPPLTYSDWMLEDETGWIYVSAWSDAQPNLSAGEEEDLGNPLEMIALVTTTSDDDYSWNDEAPFQPYLESQGVWGVQTTTDKSEYELGEEVVIIVTNIGSETLRGGGVCMSVYDTQGNLIAGGVGIYLAFEWEPGEGMVWPVPWNQTDIHGEQVPAGTYIVEVQADRFTDTAEICIIL